MEFEINRFSLNIIHNVFLLVIVIHNVLGAGVATDGGGAELASAGDGALAGDVCHGGGLRRTALHHA